MDGTLTTSNKELHSGLARGLGKPISITEIQEAIQSLQSGKLPGLDGYTVELYKTFSTLLSPALQSMYNKAIPDRRRDALSKATITLILKKG